MKLSEMNYHCRYIVTKVNPAVVHIQIGDALHRMEDGLIYNHSTRLYIDFSIVPDSTEVEIDHNWYESEIKSYRVTIELANQHICEYNHILAEYNRRKNESARSV